ncbi:MAG TPA: pseudouridine-5-phosphate glycosidase, partial [Spirochaetaceae bacterium]|nr:pseudouridine-5-phosphate glycosidase [Spirochaetaceae bacterium]
GGVVIANPIPSRYEMEPEVIEPVIQQAIAEAQARGISGKRLTPFLLEKIVEISDGDSLESNIALVKNNARLAAAVATAYSKI